MNPKYLQIEITAARHHLNGMASEHLQQPIGEVRNGRLGFIDKQRKILETSEEMLRQGITVEVAQNIFCVRAAIRELELLPEQVPPDDVTPEELEHADTWPPEVIEKEPSSERRLKS